MRRHLFRLFVTGALVGAGTAAIATAPSTADVLEQVNTKAAAECEVNEILVNPCRPWLGTRTQGYSDAPAGLHSQTEHHEALIGREVDLVHTFAAEGQLPLRNDDERYFATRDGTYLFQNWKPAARWADAGGSNAEVNAHIDAAADNVAALAPKVIFMTIHHEPENDVTHGSAGECDTKEGAAAGSPEEYRRMWMNVQERFAAQGVTNVVWVMDYMNYPDWDCLVPLLYPGDDLVDWVMFNAYGSGDSADFEANVDRFYQLLTQLDPPDRNLLDKPWGIVEWGIRNSTQDQAYAYYDQAAETLSRGQFPRLKAYQVFDSAGTHDEGGLRIGYDDAGGYDSTEVEHYRDLVEHPALSSTGGLLKRT